MKAILECACEFGAVVMLACPVPGAGHCFPDPKSGQSASNHPGANRQLGRSLYVAAHEDHHRDRRVDRRPDAPDVRFAPKADVELQLMSYVFRYSVLATRTDFAAPLFNRCCLNIWWPNTRKTPNVSFQGCVMRIKAVAKFNALCICQRSGSSCILHGIIGMN
jgi:hypothetical protein